MTRAIACNDIRITVNNRTRCFLCIYSNHALTISDKKEKKKQNKKQTNMANSIKKSAVKYVSFGFPFIFDMI